MRAKELLEFLGWSFSAPKLDNYLKSHGIFERPKLEEDFTVFLKNESEGYSLEFTERETFRETYGREKETGEFIFTGAFFYNDLLENGFQKYRGELPAELSLDATMIEARSILHAPDRTDALGTRTEDYWFANRGMDIVVSGSSDLNRIHSIYFGAVNTL